MKISCEPRQTTCAPRRDSIALLLLASVLFPGILWAAEPAGSATPYATMTLEQRLKDFPNWKFGMFLHFNTQTYHEREWSNGYEDLAAFNPAQLDCNQWMQAVKAAGMTYAVLTVKHTGGFCLWPSATTTTHDMQALAHYKEGKGDIVREFVDACRKHAIKVGLYCCMPGRYAGGLGAGPVPPGKPDLRGLPPEAIGHEIEFMKRQMSELLTGYGPIDLMWLDQRTPPEIPQHIRSLQPNCIILANQSGNSDLRVFEVPVGQRPAPGKVAPGEACDTITRNKRWFWNEAEGKGGLAALRSARDILDQLEYMNACGCNYLLNVAPDRTGLIPEYSLRRLKEVGAWLKLNADAIDGATAVPFPKPLKWGYCKQKSGKLFLYVFHWPADGRLVVPIENQVREAYLLAESGKKLPMTSGDGMTTIELPAQMPDKLATVVTLEIEGDARVSPPRGPLWPIRASSEWNNDYSAAKACDDDETTRWSAAPNTTSGWLEVDLRKDTEIGRVQVIETSYPRTQEFAIEYKAGDTWKELHRGTTINGDRTYAFTPVKARYFRLNILKASDVPTIEEFRVLPPSAPEKRGAVLFQIGQPDGSAMELGLADQADTCEATYLKAFPSDVVLTAGVDDAKKWPFIHPSTKDVWAGSRSHAYTIRFNARAPVPKHVMLVIGLVKAQHQGALEVTLNGQRSANMRLPNHNEDLNHGKIVTSAKTKVLRVPLAEGLLKEGDNALSLRLDQGSWAVYDHVLLTECALSEWWTEKEKALVTVDVSTVRHRMAGGIGANWHAVNAEMPGQRGSAWGANPPLTNAEAWNQISRHAHWLGLDWNSIEIEQRMYEPERKRFDWDNEEMRTLYRILDWCEAQRADVFLRQSYPNVEWNRLPNQPALYSAPKSLEDFAEGLMMLVDHLVNTKRYTCIKWLCICNEPHTHWWKGGCSIAEGIKAVRAALDAKGLSLPILGPDYIDTSPPVKDMEAFLGGYEIHAYGSYGDGRAKLLANWVTYARGHNKPFFVGEFGNMGLGWGGSSPRPRSYTAQLWNAQTVVRGLTAGVDGFARWSFLNRGDLDGQWQLVRTWDMEKKRHLPEAVPEPVAYFGYAMMTRFTAKHSDILSCTVIGDGVLKDIFAVALRSQGGNITILVVNMGEAEREATIDMRAITKDLRFDHYAISESIVTRPDFTLAPGMPLEFKVSAPQARIMVPALGIVTLTTHRLNSTDPGIIEDNPPRN